MMPLRRRAAVGVAVLIVAAAFVLAPWLPDGIDLYPHLLWCQESLRCFASGQLPLWLPELNAGFGSPGIRLYSPLSPVLGGGCAWLLGTADRGLRAGAAISIIACALLVRARRGRGWKQEMLLVYASPVVVNSVLGRGSWAEFAGVPVAWWLLESAVDGTARPWRHGPALALLWLVHAPTFLMVSIIIGVSAVAGRSWRIAAAWLGSGAVAAGLTAWHWAPLVNEMALVGSRNSLVGGIFDAASNVLGSPTAHRIDVTIWLGWCALGLLVAMLVAGWWRSDRRRALLVLFCISLASVVALPLWRLATPLDFLQFPWRWLMPASLLAVGGLAPRLATARGRIALVIIVLPLVLLSASFVRDPALSASLSWEESGRRIQRAIGGNPLLVDVAEHRPPSWTRLAENIARFRQGLFLLDGGGRAVVTKWTPLLRAVEVTSAGPTRLDLRLLEYPYWTTTIDGRPALTDGSRGTIAVAVPAGRHRVEVRWAGNPWSRVGQAVGGITLLLLIAWRRRPFPGQRFKVAR